MQENNFARVSFLLKKHLCQRVFFIKKDSDTGVFA